MQILKKGAEVAMLKSAPQNLPTNISPGPEASLVNSSKQLKKNVGPSQAFQKKLKRRERQSQRGRGSPVNSTRPHEELSQSSTVAFTGQEQREWPDSFHEACSA